MLYKSFKKLIKNFKKLIKAAHVIILYLIAIGLLSLFLYLKFEFKFNDIIPIIISSISIIPIFINMTKTLQLDMYLAKQHPLTLIFNKGGSYLNLKIAFHSINKPCIINDMQINIFNNTTNDEFEFEWGYFKEPSNAWVSNMTNNIFNFVTFARPIEINSDSTRSYEIEFYSTKQKNFGYSYENLKKIIYEKFGNILQEKNIKYIDDKIFREISHTIKNNDEIKKILEKDISPHNIWQSGEYTISIKTTYNRTKSLKYTYKFEISEHKSKILSADNIFDLVVLETLRTNNSKIYNIEIADLVLIDN